MLSKYIYISDLVRSNDAMPEYNTGVAKIISALRAATGLALCFLARPMLNICPKAFLW